MKSLSSIKNKAVFVIIAVILTIIYYFATIYIPYFLFSFHFIDIDKYPDLWKWSPSLMTLVASFIILLLSLLWVKLSKKTRLTQQISKTKNNKTQYFLSSIIGGLFVVIIPLGIYYLGNNHTGDSLGKEFEWWYLPALLSISIVYPIAEELFFRKGLFNILETKIGTPFTIVLSTVLFSSIHFPDSNQMIITLFAGFLIGILYAKSRKLIFPIIFHIVWNSLVILLKFTVF